MSIYNYSISNDTSNALVNLENLETEIIASTISATFSYFRTDGDNLEIHFGSTLTTEEQSSLDALIGAHDGTPTPEETKPQVVTFESTDAAGIPTVTIEKPSGNFDTVVTHNFCDKLTWVNGVTDSIWELNPAAGKLISVDKAEVQFQHDISISPTSLYLDYYAWVAPATTMMVQRITFNTMYDIFELGNEHYHSPALPEIAGGLSTVIFNYANKLRFYGDENLGALNKLVISTDSNAEITGSYATVGFVTHEADL